MAVPGETTSAASMGTNGLIRQGAAPVTRVLDVLEALGLEERSADETPATAIHVAVLEALTAGATGSTTSPARQGWPPPRRLRADRARARRTGLR